MIRPENNFESSYLQFSHRLLSGHNRLQGGLTITFVDEKRNENQSSINVDFNAYK